MKKWVYWGGMALGLFIYLLGFFDLRPARFGWYSPYILYGLILFLFIQLTHLTGVVNNLKNKIERGEKK